MYGLRDALYAPEPSTLAERIVASQPPTGLLPAAARVCGYSRGAILPGF